jgi:HAD superfamily hydrolase (TIGR01509 family)
MKQSKSFRLFVSDRIAFPHESPYMAFSLLYPAICEFPMSKPNLIIFDCDGVLIDSEIIASRVELDMLKKYDYECDEMEHIKRFTGLNFSQTIKIIEQESGRYYPDELNDKIEAEIDNRLWRNLIALPGASEVLDQLDQPRCICSNSSDERLKLSLTKTGLWDRFRPYIFSAQSMPDIAVKPAPDIFLHAAKEFEFSPQECVVIEDSVHGVSGAVAAGMRVIGYVGASHSYPGHGDQLLDAGAETIIRHLGEIIKVVEAFSEWEGLPG